MKARVKVMLSYDYCHFEIALEAKVARLSEVDELRKDAQRLADKAVSQYKIAREDASRQYIQENTRKKLSREVLVITENYPRSEWTPEQKATVKAYEDAEYALRCGYDYEDDM